MTYVNSTWPPADPSRCAEELLAAGACANARNDEHLTALEMAVRANNAPMLTVLLKHDAQRSRCALLMAIADVKNPVLLDKLLSGGDDDAFPDELLIVLLIIVIKTHSSQWSLNTEHQEVKNHELAKLLIKNIADHETFTLVAETSSGEFLSKYVTAETSSYVTAADHAQLQQHGLLGYALLTGKYSIARMLFVAGCRHKLSDMVADYIVVGVTSHPYLDEWLVPALKKPAAAEGLTSGQFFYDVRALDAIEAYDVTVRNAVLAQMNTVYPTREDAKAVSAQVISLYRD